MLSTFVVRTLLKSDSPRVIRSAAWVTAALLTRIVGVPHNRWHTCSPDTKSARRLTSRRIPRAVDPSGDSSAARASTAPASMSVSSTFRPSACNRRATWAPMPPAAPVTTAMPAGGASDCVLTRRSKKESRGVHRILAVDQSCDLERDLVAVVAQRDLVGQLRSDGGELASLERVEDLRRQQRDRRVGDLFDGKP